MRIAGRCSPVAHLSAAERAARGKAARSEVPRASHAEWEPSSARPDPIGLLEQQAQTRVPELVPIRYGRMLVSPFTFYRGAALIMASDLAATPRAGVSVQLCGDAHLSNFGIFGTPERNMMFDINDFDETHPGPWEWDVKRLAVSLVAAGRDRGFSAKRRSAVVLAAVAAYRTAMREFAAKTNLEVWYAHLDVEKTVAEYAGEFSAAQVAKTDAAIAKARTKDSLQAFAKLTHLVDGEPRIISDPPLIVPVEELFEGRDWQDLEQEMRVLFRDYRRTLTTDRRRLLEQYDLAHIARKVVGVGSVGTRAWIALFLGRDQGDPLFLQVKEAEASVLEPFLGQSAFSTRPARRRRTAPDAECKRHVSRLEARHHREPRRPTARLLRPPAARLEGQRRHRDDEAGRNGRLRPPLRLDARPRPRPLGRPDRDRLLPGQRRRLRQGDRHVLRSLRRPERTRLCGTRRSGELRADRGPDGPLGPPMGSSS